MPKTGRGTYPLRDAVRFYVGYLQRLLDENNTNTMQAEKIRMLRARATRAEIEAKKSGGEVLDVERVRHEGMVLGNEIKDQFCALPGRIAPVLIGLEAGQIKSKLEESVTATLNVVAARIEKYVAKFGSSSAENKNL